MKLSAPKFWWRRPGPASFALSPLGAIYGAVAEKRLRDAPAVPPPLPTICVGNPTVGGAGKTPTALAIGRAAIDAQHRPGFLTRGYGRSLSGTHVVDAARHGARDVGDEPLLLAALAPTVVATDRVEGAEFLKREGCDLIVMDDGFQSRALAPDLALLVVDGARGLGNGRVLPAGPLRAPLDAQLAFADALIVVDAGGGSHGANAVVEAAARADVDVLRAELSAVASNRLQGRDVVAFCGLGDPDRFVAMLERTGARVKARRDFPDHHPFDAGDLAELSDLAEQHAATLVTTAKDAARLKRRTDLVAPPHEVLEVEMVLEGEAATRLVREAVRRGQSRGAMAMR